MQKKFMLFRIVVWVICIYHVMLGIVLNCPVEGISWIVTHFLGATKMPDSSALFLARMLGGYMLCFGVGMGLAAWDPVKNRSILSLGAGLVVLRSIQRIVQADALQETLGLSSQANWTAIVILLVFAVFLVAFRLSLYKDSKKTILKG